MPADTQSIHINPFEMKTLKINLIWILLALFNITATSAQDSVKPYKANTLNELQESIQRVLKETNTPGAGVVLISGDSTILLKGFGKADIENNVDVDENTMFRLGSVSKVYVALAILKLQEEGRLNLKDKIRDLIPEIEFYNRWEDEWSFAELASNDPKPKTLKESLEYYPKARKSNFVPGTRIHYSNLGTSIAAYIVEKVSGLSYEDYIDTYFFTPMGIENMTFLNSEQYKKYGAKLYDDGIKLSYLNILYRPSAALNGSPKDMAKMIKFFIDRGRINNHQILSDSSLQRMERSGSLPVLSTYETHKRYGLANNPSSYNGFIYRGHGGTIFGGHADFEYLPEYKMGYAVMINGEGEETVDRIAELIKHYQTKDLIKTPVEIDSNKYEITIDPSGYYTIINPKLGKWGFFDRFNKTLKVWVKNDTLFIKNLKRNFIGKFIPAGGNEFRSVENNIAVLSLINDPLEGNIIFAGTYYKKVSLLRAYTPALIFFSFITILITTVIFGLLWVLVYLFGKRKSKTALWICLWPLITNSFIFVVGLLMFMTVKTRYDIFQVLGTANMFSVLMFICGIGYALASVWSVYYIFKNYREKMSRFFYYYSALAAILNLVLMLYFLSNGLIGIPTWI